MKVQLASLTLPIAVHAQGTVRGAMGPIDLSKNSISVPSGPE